MPFENYTIWRDSLFNVSEGEDPVMYECGFNFNDLPSVETLSYLDRMFVDQEIHSNYSLDQISFALNVIYSSTCSDISYAYIDEEIEKTNSLFNLNLLYNNFFLRYCTNPFIFGQDSQNKMDYICFMLWDVFVVYPKAISKNEICACLQVMQQALNTSNEYVVMSALHGLGHWALYLEEHKYIIKNWQNAPTVSNPKILEYSEKAYEGSVL